MGPLTLPTMNEETQLALRMLKMTRELLDGGNRWRAHKLASGRLGFSCDPLSSRAHYFSLVGAAVRIRWELREELAQASMGEIRVVDILRALATAPGTPYRGEQGWSHVESILAGLEFALTEFEASRVYGETAKQA